VYDALAMRNGWETLSVAHGRCIQSKRRRALVAGCESLLVLHLWWGLPIPGQKLLRKTMTNKGK
jgi:hypothetical protein